MRIFIISLFISLAFAGTVQAQEYVDQFKDWTVFKLQKEGAPTCYIASAPVKETGNYKKRGDRYLLVTRRGKDVYEISVSSGYPYKEGSTVEIKVDGKTKANFFTTNKTPEIAWALKPSDDKSVVDGMIKGYKMTVKGFSRLGTHSVDTYSLMGFTKAFDRMKSECN